MSAAALQSTYCRYPNCARIRTGVRGEAQIRLARACSPLQSVHDDSGATGAHAAPERSRDRIQSSQTAT
eukprot:3194237-Pleurochrysis_carterae.AAC.3